jgi:hypothetical protein
MSPEKNDNNPSVNSAFLFGCVVGGWITLILVAWSIYLFGH